ncbi:MAG: hypothetical protein RL106_1354 [Bacteroidota bacterium]
MRSLILLFIFALPFSGIAQKATISSPLLPKNLLIIDVSSDKADEILSQWEIDTLILKNLKWDQKIIDSVETLLGRTSNSQIIASTHKKLIEFYTYHKKSDKVAASRAVIQEIQNREIAEKQNQLAATNDSLAHKIMELQSKDAFNQELIGQTKGEQELWFFVTWVMVGLFLIMVVLYFLKGGKKEKEIVYREKKVIVHEPAPVVPVEHTDTDELKMKVLELEKLYKNSLQTIQHQDGEKIERNLQVAEVIQFLREAQGDLKKIQENKTMTAEDFMRLSNAVQRSISKLN